MKRMPSVRAWSLAVAGAVLAAAGTLHGAGDRVAGTLDGFLEALRKPEWIMRASVIEGCSCPMLCQCYFNDRPAEHDERDPEGHVAHRRYCRFNEAYQVRHGNYGGTLLDGVKFWLAGDRGPDFGNGEMSWAVLTFDRAMDPAQRDAVAAIMVRLVPFKWKSFTTAEGDIEWLDQGHSIRLESRANDHAHATLDGGKTAEILLRRPAGAEDPALSTIVENVRFWGATENDGLVMMPSEIEAWRAGDDKFEYRGTSGFTTSIQIDSKSVAAAAARVPAG
jgi:hypothetical protein